MKPSKALRLAVVFSLAVVLSSRDVRQARDGQLQTAEERELVTKAMMEDYLKQQDDVAGPVMELALAGAGTIKTLSSINYNQTGGEVARDVANAVVPVIGAALALVPGVGPFISGLFMGVWSLISPLFASKKDNPMEKMLNELAQKMAIKMDAKLSSIINRAIYGEITRNNYICTKYNFMSEEFSEQLNSSTILETVDALKLTGYLNDCDNFLKDTAEAFVYDEYADVLWVPSAITTSVRASFVTEVIKIGRLIGIGQRALAMYFQELQNDIERQFKLHHTGLNKLRQNVSHHYQWTENYLTGISSVEESACKIQSQLLYFNRELYPYGMPTVLNSTDLFAEVRMSDHYNPAKDGTVKHVQVFFDIDKLKLHDLPSSNWKWYDTLKIMNCIIGPMYPRFPSTFWFKFSPMPSNEYSYEFRVIYFQTRDYLNNYTPTYPVPILLAEKGSDSKEHREFEKTYRDQGMGEPNRDDIHLQIKFVAFNDPLVEGSKKVLNMSIVAHWEHCPYDHNKGYTAQICDRGVKFYEGVFLIYYVGTYNVDNYNAVNKLFRISNPNLPFQGKSNVGLEYGFLVGVEVILRPRIV